MNRTNIKWVAVGLLLALTLAAVPVYAQDAALSSPSRRCHGPAGEFIVGDALFLRPAGMIAMGFGAAMSVVTFPFAAMSNSLDRMGQKYFVEPYEYTFVRPLGDYDYACDQDMVIRY